METAKAGILWIVTDWESEESMLRGGKPLRVVEFPGNILVNSGIQLTEKLLSGIATTPVFGSSSYLGVGDGDTGSGPGVPTVSVTDTNLYALANNVRQVMDSGYPALNGNTLIWRATFASGTANFAWNEAGLFTAASGGTMFNHKGQAMGTKIAGTPRTLELDLILS